MRTQRAVSLFILGLFLVSAFSLGVLANHIGDVTGAAEKEFKPSYLPQGFDLSGAAKSIADFGGVSQAEEWYYVPMSIMILTLIVFLLLKKSVFQKIVGGGHTEDIVVAIIAICFGTLAVYKTKISVWVAAIGTYGVIAMGIGLLAYIIYGAYTGGRGAFGDLRRAHLEGLKERTESIAAAKKGISEVKRAAYLTEEDEASISKMEELGNQISTEDLNIIEVAERIRQQFAQALAAWGRQPYMFKGSSPKVRAEILRIIPEVEWLRKAIRDLKQREKNRYDNLLKRIRALTVTDDKLLAGRLAKRTNGIIKYKNKLIGLDKTELKKDFSAEKPLTLAKERTDQTEDAYLATARKIVEEIRKYLKESEVLIADINAYNKAIIKTSLSIVPLEKAVQDIKRWTGMYSSTPQGMKYFQEGLQAATAFEAQVKKIYAEEQQNKTFVHKLKLIEDRIKALEAMEVKELLMAEKEEELGKKEEILEIRKEEKIKKNLKKNYKDYNTDWAKKAMDKMHKEGTRQ